MDAPETDNIARAPGLRVYAPPLIVWRTAHGSRVRLQRDRLNDRWQAFSDFNDHRYAQGDSIEEAVDKVNPEYFRRAHIERQSDHP